MKSIRANSTVSVFSHDPTRDNIFQEVMLMRDYGRRGSGTRFSSAYQGTVSLRQDPPPKKDSSREPTLIYGRINQNTKLVCTLWGKET